jgi:hypothetical protein
MRVTESTYWIYTLPLIAFVFRRLGLVRQPEASQGHSSEANAESLECRSARAGLSEALRQFIEFVIHTFLLSLICRSCSPLPDATI